jgi:cytidine deaminase
MPGHSRSDTALIYGLSTTEVDKLAEACVEAKSKAYCTFAVLLAKPYLQIYPRLA